MVRALIDNVNEYMHIVVNIFGMSANLFLMTMVLTKTPETLRSYGVLIFNFALTDFGACFTALMVQQRLIPCGFSLMYISYGWCTYFSPTVCYVGYSYMLGFYAHTLISMPLSFAYRYFILVRPSPEVWQVVTACVVLYIPSLLQSIAFSLSKSEDEVSFNILKNYYKDYNLTGETVSGNENVLHVWTLLTILWMTVPCFPIYSVILYFRQKVVGLLDANEMSEKTRKMHKQLLMGITLQACLPGLFSLAVITYSLEQFGIVHHPFLEHFAFQILGCIPPLTPLLSFYFVAPYRKTLKSLFMKIEDRTKLFRSSVQPSVSVTSTTMIA